MARRLERIALLRLSTALVFIVMTAVASRTFGDEQKPAELSLEQLAASVVYIHTQITKDEASVGTGFLTNLEGQIYLITASHVAKTTEVRTKITYAVETDKAETLTLSSMVPTGHSPKWVVHPSADVAVLALELSGASRSRLAPRALPPVVFISDLVAPPRNRPLTTVGFPLGLGVNPFVPDGRISPITKESRAASGLLTFPRADTRQPATFFVLDSPSIGGFSGAPVFIAPGAFSQGAGIVFSGVSFCVGLVHGTISDNTGGKLAAVVPVRFIVESLEAAHSTRHRR